MIWLTSDPHSGKHYQGIQDFLTFCTDDDWLIILGDIGLYFRETELCDEFCKFFESLQCNIAFIDGNHENFDYLDSLPQEDWHGGRVHRISDRIVHLMRGYVFEIGGKTFVTMGGCVSSKKWKEMGLWYPQENPTPAEIQRGYDNLAAHGNRVDYVLTHKYQIDPEDADPLTLTGFSQYIEENVTYTHWYSGHWHKTIFTDEKHTVVFEELVHI